MNDPLLAHRRQPWAMSWCSERDLRRAVGVAGGLWLDGQWTLQGNCAWLFRPGVMPDGAVSMAAIWPGRPFPLGATYDGPGVNFSIFSEVAERIDLCLFDEYGRETA